MSEEELKHRDYEDPPGNPPPTVLQAGRETVLDMGPTKTKLELPEGLPSKQKIVDPSNSDSYHRRMRVLARQVLSPTDAQEIAEQFPRQKYE